MQKMTGYTTTDGIDRPVYDGWNRFLGDRGVAEAPSAFLYNGRYCLIFSSRPSDVDQRIMLITADNPWFRKPSRPLVLLSPRREGFDSIGGQALVRLRSGGQTQHYVLYQGFKKGQEGWPFHLAPIDGFLARHVRPRK